MALLLEHGRDRVKIAEMTEAAPRNLESGNEQQLYFVSQIEPSHVGNHVYGT